MSASCVNSGSPVRRDLPAAPEFAKPVVVPEPKRGETLILVAARERAGRLQANRIIVAFRDWYAGVRSDYAGEGP